MAIKTLQFDSTIRAIRQLDHEKIKGMYEAVEAKMAACKLHPNRRKAVGGLPAGSDNYNATSFQHWLTSIPEPPADGAEWTPDAETSAAYDQLVAIHATLAARM